LVAKKILLAEILCFVGIMLLLQSASRTLMVLTVGTGSSSYYFGLQGALAPFENLEGIVGTLFAMTPLFLLAFTRD
jgi:preprotein translocase subunit SecG